MKYPEIKLSFIFFLLITAITSCVPDDELGPDTGDPRDKFIGQWNFDESQSARGISYPVTISYNEGNSSQVFLSNFGRVGSSYEAYGIVTSNRITVPYQELSDGFYVEGSGTMSSTDAMNWEYSITAGGDIEEFTAFASR